MADPFGRGSSSSGSRSSSAAKDPFGRGGSGATKPGGGNFFGNLVHDAESTLANIPGGVVHLVKDPVGTVKNIGHSYAQTYGPLFHGKFGKFFHGIEQHPLGPILDAATLATLGAGGVAKAGQLLAKAGAISDASRLARLGDAATLTAPDFAKSAGQLGEDIPLKMSSRNPLIRTRQQAVNAGLNKLPNAPGKLGVAGEKIQSARITKALGREPQRTATGLRQQAIPFQQAFEKLTAPERAAWHLTARAVDPAHYKAFLESQKAPVPAAMLKLLAHPKVSELVANPTAKLTDALEKGRALSEHLGALKVQAGHISEQSAVESPYRLLRLVNGAKIDENGVTDAAGRDIPTLAKELEQQGKKQPFYVPDSAETGKGAAGTFRSKPTGLAEPALSGSSKQNLGILASRGMIAVKQNPLAREFGRFANHTEGSLLHDEIVKHAAELPKGNPLPPGYEYLKLNRGEASAPYTEKIGGEFEHALAKDYPDKVLTKDEASTDIATRNGNRLIVPSQVRDILQNRATTYHGTLHNLLYNQPTSVWKHLVLGLRPAFFGNITIGNSILGALQMAPGRHGLAGWVNQLAPGAEKLLGKKLTAKTLEKVMPEQAAGTFGHSTGFTSNKGLTLAHKAYQGVMPATIAYENVLRRAMAEGWAKATPEVRAAMKKNGGDVNAALVDVAKSHPQVINDISKRVDDALGNYRSYNQLEQKIKQLIPFYGWDRHIARSAGRLASERPATLNALTKLGTEGKQQQDKILGELPSYMQGDIKLGSLPGILGPLNGRTPVLSTHSWNPFNTLADLARIPEALTGTAGGSGSEALSSGLNPLVQALIEQMTGRSLLSGAPIKGNALANAGKAVPQASLLYALLGKGTPTKATSLYQNDAAVKLAGLLGFPVKKAALNTAHLYGAQEKSGKR